MSTLRKQEALGPGLKRIACAQVESAIRYLTRQAGQAESAASAIQQAQSVLTLIELDLPRPSVRRDRAILSRLSSGLEEMAEPTRLLERLSRAYKKTPSDSDLAAAVKALRKRLSSRDQSASAMSSKAGSFNPSIYRLVADMAELRGHMDLWPVDAVPDDAPPRGLRRSYTKARRLASEPMTVDSADALISALSEVSTQLGIISKACPAMLKAQRKLVARSADALRDERESDRFDKALREQLGKTSSKALPRQKPLAKRSADAMGPELELALAETPAAFMRRVQAYWIAWRSDPSAG